MDFKYQQDYNTLTDACPPKDHLSQNMDPVCRWVFDSMDDERNFKSQFHKSPKRFLSKDDLTKCSALALSMFNSLAGSVQRFNELKDVMGEAIHQTLGTKIAQGKISLTIIIRQRKSILMMSSP